MRRRRKTSSLEARKKFVAMLARNELYLIMNFIRIWTWTYFFLFLKVLNEFFEGVMKGVFTSFHALFLSPILEELVMEAIFTLEVRLDPNSTSSNRVERLAWSGEEQASISCLLRA